jgi:hypothetical protein
VWPLKLISIRYHAEGTPVDKWGSLDSKGLPVLVWFPWITQLLLDILSWVWGSNFLKLSSAQSGVLSFEKILSYSFLSFPVSFSLLMNYFIFSICSLLLLSSLGFPSAFYFSASSLIFFSLSLSKSYLILRRSALSFSSFNFL